MPSMITFFNIYRIPAALIIIAVVAYFSVDYIVKTRVTNLQAHIEQKIIEQKVTLSTLLEITARNGADTVTSTVIRDCNVEERKEFDVLLGRLDQGLLNSELTKLDLLFGRCGYFFAQRKAVMVSRLAREVNLYEDFVTQLEVISGSSKHDAYAVDTWRAVVQAEEKQSDLFMNLVLSQDNIIKTLLSGKSADSAEILTILKDVKENQETLAVMSKQTSDMRLRLLLK